MGFHIAKLLNEKQRFELVLAGRDHTKATVAAKRVGSGCRGIALDATRQDVFDQLKGYKLCVNLTEATPISLLAALIANGTHVIDSSASPGYVAELCSTVNSLPSHNATCIPEVGLAPGLTNLLGFKLLLDRPDTCSIDVLIQMGLGVHHGLAATRWILQSLGSSYPIKAEGQWRKEVAGNLTRYFHWSRKLRIRGVGFGFSDQINMAVDLNLTGARTFLAFDPPWVTWLMQWLSTSPAQKLVKRYSRAIASKLLILPRMGSPKTRLVLEGRDQHGEVTQVEKLQGGPQSELTAIVISEAVTNLLNPETDLPCGVQSLHKLMDASSIMKKIDEHC